MTVVSPISYGAVGDGVANDSAAFNSAIAALPSGGGVVDMQGRPYGLLNSVNIDKPVRFINGSKFIALSATGDLLKVGSGVEGFSCSEVTFDVSSAIARTSGAAINIAGDPNLLGAVIGPVITNNIFRNQFLAINVDYAQHPVISGNTAFDTVRTGSGIVIGNQYYVHGATVSGNHLQVSDAKGKAAVGIRIGWCDVYFIGFNSSVRHEIGVSIKPVGSGQYAGTGKLIGNNLDTSTIAVLVEPENGGRVYTLLVDGNWLSASTAAAAKIRSNSGIVRGVSITNNEAKYGSGNGIVCEGPASGTAFDGLFIRGNVAASNPSGRGIDLSGVITHVSSSNNYCGVELNPAGIADANHTGYHVNVGVSGKSCCDDVAGNSVAQFQNLSSTFAVAA